MREKRARQRQKVSSQLETDGCQDASKSEFKLLKEPNLVSSIEKFSLQLLCLPRIPAKHQHSFVCCSATPKPE
jgi:hypothetical protein